MFALNTKNIWPLLSNLQASPFLHEENTLISPTMIQAILQDEPIQSKVSIAIFSTYQFVVKNAYKKIITNIIGHYQHPQSKITIHLLLTPVIHNNTQFGISLLPWTHLPESITKHSYFSIPHLTEGFAVHSNQNKNSQPDDTILNQEHCICEQKSLTLVNTKDTKITGDKLASNYVQKFLLYENLNTVGWLSDNLAIKLKLCSLISFLSFDTESINKSFFQNLNIDENHLFENAFRQTPSATINRGVQKLYVIGLFDSLPIHLILNTLKTALPTSFVTTLTNFVTYQHKHKGYKKEIDWEKTKTLLDKHSLSGLAETITNLLSNISPHQNHVKVFHIHKNSETEHYTEPTSGNIKLMTYKFFYYIYQRNVLATLIKYVLLKPYLQQLENSGRIDQKKGIFYLIYQRMKEILFESVLITFNGGNYDNYLIANALLRLMNNSRQKINIFKKGANLSTILLHFKNMLYIVVHHMNLNLQKTTKNEKDPVKQ